MVDSIVLINSCIYFDNIVRLTEVVEREHSIKVMCSALFSSIPMGLNTRRSDIDVFMLAEDLSKSKKLLPNVQIYYDDKFGLLQYENSCDSGRFQDHRINGNELKYDVCINDINTVQLAIENYERPKYYPSYHNTNKEDHLREGDKTFFAQERSSRIFLQRMLVYRNIWDKECYLRNNWNDIHRKHLRSIEIMDMWYTTAYGHVDFSLTKEKVQLRKYLNMMNSLLAMKWIMQYNTLPPILFTEIVEICDNPTVKDMVIQLYLLHESQTEDKHKVYIDNIPLIKSYYLNEIAEIRSFMEKLNSTNPYLCLQV